VIRKGSDVMDTVYLSHIDDLEGSPWEYGSKDIILLYSNITSGLSALNIDLSHIIFNKNILIKANLVRAHKNLSFTTDFRVLEAVLKLLRDYGAKEITVGDNSSYDANTDQIGNDLGLPNIVKKYGAKFLPFELDEQVLVKNKNATLLNEFHLPKIVIECDYIINIPKLKTHTLTQVSLAVKNHHGLISKTDRLLYHRDDINEKLLDIYSFIKDKEILHIIDGLWALEGQGPCDQGEQIPNFNCLLIGSNAISVDAVASSLMGFDPREVPSVRIGDWRGLGAGRLENIQIMGVPLVNVQRHFKRPICAVSGMYREVRAIEFSSCKGCTGHAMVSLDIMSDLGELKHIPSNVVLILGDPPDGFVPEWKDKDIWLIGCATSSTKKFLQSGNVYTIEGCPPWLADLRNAMMEIYKIP
jgi:uncharacterized protein (DUF362 family)